MDECPSCTNHPHILSITLLGSWHFLADLNTRSILSLVASIECAFYSVLGPIPKALFLVFGRLFSDRVAFSDKLRWLSQSLSFTSS